MEAANKLNGIDFTLVTIGSVKGVDDKHESSSYSTYSDNSKYFGGVLNGKKHGFGYHTTCERGNDVG